MIKWCSCQVPDHVYILHNISTMLKYCIRPTIPSWELPCFITPIGPTIPFIGVALLILRSGPTIPVMRVAMFIWTQWSNLPIYERCHVLSITMQPLGIKLSLRAYLIARARRFINRILWFDKHWVRQMRRLGSVELWNWARYSWLSCVDSCKGHPLCIIAAMNSAALSAASSAAKSLRGARWSGGKVLQLQLVAACLHAGLHLRIRQPAFYEAAACCNRLLCRVLAPGYILRSHLCSRCVSLCSCQICQVTLMKGWELMRNVWAPVAASHCIASFWQATFSSATVLVTFLPASLPGPLQVMHSDLEGCKCEVYCNITCILMMCSLDRPKLP